MPPNAACPGTEGALVSLDPMMPFSRRLGGGRESGGGMGGKTGRTAWLPLAGRIVLPVGGINITCEV